MGYALLWTIALACGLLLLATLMACIGRLKRTRVRVALSVLAALVPALGCIALIGVIEWAKAEPVALNEFERPMWILTLFYGVGAIWILFCGLRPSRQRPEVPGAAAWPRGKLALALAASVALYMMTIWNLDVAVRQRVATLKVEAGAVAASAAPVRIPDRDNAAVIYQQAHELMPPDESWDETWTEWANDGSSEFDPEDAKLREFLEAQTPTMRLLRQASEKPGCCFDHAWADPGIDVLLPGLVSIRAGSRLLALDARSRAAAGDFRTALADTNAMFAMAEHAGSEPALLGVMVAAGMDHMACMTLEAVLTSGEASANELALLDVADTVSYQRLFARALWMEEAVVIATYCDYGATFRYTEMLNRPRLWWEGKFLAPLYRVFMFDDDLASYREILKKCRGLAGQPYYQVSQRWQSFQGRLDGRTRGLLTNLMVPAIYRAAERAAEADARRRLAQLAVAVSRHRAAENQFPDTLADLVPEFLPAVPLDPFDGSPLRVKRTDQELVLYSVGPDGADDDGAPFDGQKRTGDLTFRLAQ